MNSGTIAGLTSAPLKTKGLNFIKGTITTNGDLNLIAGNRSSSNPSPNSIPVAGKVSITAIGSASNPGDVTISGGDGTPDRIAYAGNVSINGGSAFTGGGISGNVSISTGSGAAGVLSGSDINLLTGNTSTVSGNIQLRTGLSSTLTTGVIYLTPGNGRNIELSRSSNGTAGLLSYNVGSTAETNYERAFMGWALSPDNSTNEFIIDIQKAGTGVQRGFSIKLGGNRIANIPADDNAAGTGSGFGQGWGNGSGALGSTYLGSSTASGSYSLAAGWQANASASFSNSIGAFTISDISGRTSICPGQGPVNGANQRSGLQSLTASTSDATVTQLSVPNTGLFSFADHKGCILNSNNSITVQGVVTAISTVATNIGNTASFFIQASFQNSGGNMSIVGTPIITQMSNNSNAWSIAAAVDNTNKIWQLNVTGAIATNIKWSAMLNVSQIL